MTPSREEIIDVLQSLNQEGGDATAPDDNRPREPAGKPGSHVAPPASGDVSGRAIAEQIAKSHIDTGFGEAMDELMAGELADKIERALASEYERGVAAGRTERESDARKALIDRWYAAGRLSGIEEAATIVSQARFGEIDSDLRSIIASIRSLITKEVKP